MSEMALPCIVCRRDLTNVWPEAANQPSDGVAFSSPGNYGSTVFDPVLTGEFIEINVCDPCLVAAANADRVLVARTKRPVAIDRIGIIGWIDAPYAPVPWKEGMPGYDDLLYVEDVAEFHELPDNPTLSRGLTDEILTPSPAVEEE